MFKTVLHPEWVEKVKIIATNAAEIVADVYHTQRELFIQLKSDNSPLTIADTASDHYIRSQLRLLTPHIPIISEEMVSELSFPQPPETLFWLVDPLDGTKEFIERTGEFSVNIALIQAHRPVLGVVAVPLKQACYWGEKQKGSYFQAGNALPNRLIVNIASETPLTIAISRFHCIEPDYAAFIEKAKQWNASLRLLEIGSALKICLVAQGLADIYPRFGPTSAWDTAAGQLILEEANGHLVDLSNGMPLKYGNKTSLLNPPFIATTTYYLEKVFEKSSLQSNLSSAGE
ncbi:MAG: hypothetical protein RLZ35_768 [Pseudomonadota bacterium]